DPWPTPDCTPHDKGVCIPTGVCYPPTTDLETRCIDDEQQQQLRSDILELLRAPKQPLQQMHRP
ncbi:hypothetical protein EJB05_24522, partial [Eragrostis curvula]